MSGKSTTVLLFITSQSYGENYSIGISKIIALTVEAVSSKLVISISQSNVETCLRMW